MAVNIPTKINIPPDLNMSDPAEIEKVWVEIQMTAQYINDIIDVLENNKSSLDNAVYVQK